MISSIIHYWNYAPTCVAVIVSFISIIIWALIVFALDRKIEKKFGYMLLVISLFGVFVATFWGRHFDHRQIDLIPFSFLKRGTEEPTVYREFWMNSCLFFPLGSSFGLIEKNKCLIFMLCGVVLSLLIEVFQFCFMLGMCECDDVIANSLGCALGLIITVCTLNYKNKRSI